MSGSSRSRQKRKLEPISIEELAGTTGMSGFCSFLTRDAAVPVPALDSLESGAPESGAPERDAPKQGAPERTAPGVEALEPRAPHSDGLKLVGPPQSVSPVPADASAPDLSAPITGAPLTGAPDFDSAQNQYKYANQGAPGFTAPESAASPTDAGPIGALDPNAPEAGAPDWVFQRRVRIREAVTVQDGHSLAEQAVYDAMYRAGKPYNGDSRILTIGLRTLAELSRMAYSNCKANVRSLAAKLAIDERPGFSYTTGRTYIIYSFRDILRRRKAVGLTHVVRTRGVAFVDPETGQQLAVSSAPVSGAPDRSAPPPYAPDSSGGAPEPATTGAPASPKSGAPGSAAHIRNRNLTRNPGEESSSAVPRVITALRAHVPDVDDDAATDLLNACLENAPEATVEEIVHFIHLKAGKPGIRLPLGFLLTAVPRCFKGDSYRQFREERDRARQAEQNRDRMFAEEILKSPHADDEQRQWAMELLGRA